MTQALWPTCGYTLLTHNEAGHLVVTDDFLRFLLERPELAPIASSCAAEVALHHSLVDQPRREVSAQELAELQDKDAADNYAVWLRFRQRITTLPTLEASYIALFKGEGVDVPPLLVQHITHILLRHVLGEAPTAMQARAAEMLMHTQEVLYPLGYYLTQRVQCGLTTVEADHPVKALATGPIGVLVVVVEHIQVHAAQFDAALLEQFTNRAKATLRGVALHGFIVRRHHGAVFEHGDFLRVHQHLSRARLHGRWRIAQHMTQQDVGDVLHQQRRHIHALAFEQSHVAGF